MHETRTSWEAAGNDSQGTCLVWISWIIFCVCGIFFSGFQGRRAPRSVHSLCNCNVKFVERICWWWYNALLLILARVFLFLRYLLSIPTPSPPWKVDNYLPWVLTLGWYAMLVFTTKKALLLKYSFSKGIHIFNFLLFGGGKFASSWFKIMHLKFMATKGACWASGLFHLSNVADVSGLGFLNAWR